MPWLTGWVDNGRPSQKYLALQTTGAIFYTLKEAKVLIEDWRNEYNTIRPHSSLGYRPPAPEVIQQLGYEPFWNITDREIMPPLLT